MYAHDHDGAAERDVEVTLTPTLTLTLALTLALAPTLPPNQGEIKLGDFGISRALSTRTNLAQTMCGNALLLTSTFALTLAWRRLCAATPYY